MFDPVCKFLVENYSADFANWLLGEPIALSIVQPSELLLEPIRADSIILLRSSQSSTQKALLHLEFQTQPERKIPFRMLDYYVRIYRTAPDKTIRQIVIYLRPSRSPLVYQTQFQSPTTSHHYEVIRLWEQPFESFLSSPGLLPFAILSKVDSHVEALQTIAERIRDTPDSSMQQSIAASTAILAGLVSLDQSLIQRIIGMDLLEESTVYQSIHQEGRQAGLQEGRQEGERLTLLRLLTRKLGPLPAQLIDKIGQLSIDQLNKLTDSLLDFTTVSDLEAWLSDAE